MIESPAEILREYGPFPGADAVHGVTFDGQYVWFASGDKLNVFDPESGMIVRRIDANAHAGTAFDGRHLFQLFEKRIQKIDPKTGQRAGHHPRPRRRRRFRDGVGRGLAVGRPASRAQDPSDRSRDRPDPAHHRVQPLRHRRHLGRGRAVARHLGERRERAAANRSADRRGPGGAQDADRRERVGARVRRRRPLLLRRRPHRQGARRAPAAARGGARG